MTYGSNKSLYYPDEELDLNLRTGPPLEKSFEKVDVLYVYVMFPPLCVSHRTYLYSLFAFAAPVPVVAAKADKESYRRGVVNVYCLAEEMYFQLMHAEYLISEEVNNLSIA